LIESPGRLARPGFFVRTTLPHRDDDNEVLFPANGGRAESNN
jgi:hypothetical protein